MILRGRIGKYGRLIHALCQYDERGGKGMALCRALEGTLRRTEDAIDCPDCLARLEGMQPRSVP